MYPEHQHAPGLVHFMQPFTESHSSTYSNMWLTDMSTLCSRTMVQGTKSRLVSSECIKVYREAASRLYMDTKLLVSLTEWMPSGTFCKVADGARVYNRWLVSYSRVRNAGTRGPWSFETGLTKQAAAIGDHGPWRNGFKARHAVDCLSISLSYRIREDGNRYVPRYLLMQDALATCV